MNKHTLAPLPMPMQLRRGSSARVATSGFAMRAVLPAVVLQLAGAILAMELVPFYGDTVSGLFSVVTDSLRFALDRA